jgi:hypothetical protein
MPIQALIIASAATLASGVAIDAPTRAAINGACYAYIDAQLEGNEKRIAAALHPQAIVRAVQTREPHTPLELDIETRQMLLDSTRKGVLRKPRGEWQRSCTILDVSGNAAAVRMDEGGYVEYFHIGNFGGKWLVVDGFWVKES